jgi:hypothetical protein
MSYGQRRSRRRAPDRLLPEVARPDPVRHSLLHKSFVRVRHYGLLANGQREARLAVCGRLVLVANVAARLPNADTAAIEPAQPRCCPHCGGTRLGYRELAPAEPAGPVAVPDSS